MITFFVLLVLLMVLVAVAVPMLNGGGGRRVIYERRRPDYVDADVVEVIDDEPAAERLEPIARRRVVRRSRRVY
jgi:hypothetical protein